MAVRGLTMDVARPFQRNGLANLAGAMAFRVIRALVPSTGDLDGRLAVLSLLTRWLFAACVDPDVDRLWSLRDLHRLVPAGLRAPGHVLRAADLRVPAGDAFLVGQLDACVRERS
jgi:hypothetical protein